MKIQLQTSGAENGFAITTEVAVQQSSDIWFNGQNISQSSGMEFAPRVNRNGDIAWADVFGDSQKDSISKNDVYFNGRLIAQDSPVQDIALSDDYLAWVSPDGVGTQVTFYNILTHELMTQSLDFATDTIRNLRGDFVVSGLDVGTGDAISAHLNPDQTPVKTNHGDTYIQITGHHLTPMEISVTGDPAGMALFNATSMIDEYSDEALAITTEDTGRVANMFAPRLVALNALAELTGRSDLQDRAAQAALNVATQADVNGLYFASRYSIADTPVAWSMHSGLILGSALGATTWMSPENRGTVIQKAVSAFEYFESDWLNGAYVITPNSGVDYDGIIQPNNMQAVMGSFALKLYEQTHEQRFLDRANDIFTLLANELIEYNGTNVFHYWPAAFRDGWDETEFSSTTRPTGDPYSSSLFDDVYHGDLVIRFLEEIAIQRGTQPLVDSNALFDLVQLDDYVFSGFLNGGPSGLDWLPPWPSAQQFQALATRPFPTTLGFYDEGVHIAATSQAAQFLGAGGVGTVNVTLRDPLTRDILEVVTLAGADDISSWVLDLKNRYSSTVSQPALVLGNDNGETLGGTVDDDVIRALDGDDVLKLKAGNDAGFGDRGNDHLQGEAGDDLLAGGDGHDRLEGGAGADQLLGQLGNDTLEGGEDNDLLAGGEGNDTLEGGGGADQLFGGYGNDTLTGNTGANTLEGGAGADVIVGGSGIDTASYAGSSAGVSVNLASGAISGGDAQGDVLSGVENILGSAHNDTLTGDTAANRLIGGDGNDALNGGDGADRLYGGDGNDTLDAGSVSGATWQYVYGAAGNDTYRYSKEDNNVYIAAAAETATSGTADAVVFTDLNASDVVWSGYQDYTATYSTEGKALRIAWQNGTGGSREIQIAQQGQHIESYTFADGSVFQSFVTTNDQNQTLTGTAQNNFMHGNSGADILLGQAGADRLMGGAGSDLLEGGAGADVIVGGSGIDTASYAGSSAGVSVNLASGAISGGDAQGDVLSGVENILGSAHNDTLTGDTAANRLIGGDGADRLYGGDGNDTLDAGSVSGATWQYVFGESGNDTYRYSQSSGNVFVASESASTGTADQFVFTDLSLGQISFDTIDYGTSYGGNIGMAVRLRWNESGTAREAQLALEGQHIETYAFTGGTTVNRFIVAGASDTTLSGTSGNDVIVGNGLANTFTGGAGDDVFVFEAGFGADTIADFTASNAEKIDLTEISGITDFVDLTTNHLSDNSGTARITLDSGNTIDLTGITVGQIGIALDYSAEDFLF